MKTLLSKSIVVEASHRLEAHNGKCHRLHGHSWKIEVTVESQVNPLTNMGLDYYHLSDFLKTIHEQIDHQDLNSVFKEANPTSEFLANWVFTQATIALEPIPRGDFEVYVTQVSIWETASSRCILTREQWLD